MSFSVEKKHHKCMYIHGYDLLKKGFHNDGLSLLKELAEREISISLKISVLNSLAVDAEWRLKDVIQALNYTDALLQIENLGDSLRNKLHRRKERLLDKSVF